MQEVQVSQIKGNIKYQAYINPSLLKKRASTVHQQYFPKLKECSGVVTLVVLRSVVQNAHEAQPLQKYLLCEATVSRTVLTMKYRLKTIRLSLEIGPMHLPKVLSFCWARSGAIGILAKNPVVATNLVTHGKINSCY